MLFQFAIFDMTGKQLCASQNTRLCGAPEASLSYLTRLKDTRLFREGAGTPIESIRFHRGFPKSVRERVERARPILSDAYAIRLARVTTVYAATDTACVHAMVTLCQMAEAGVLCEGFFMMRRLPASGGIASTCPRGQRWHSLRKYSIFSQNTNTTASCLRSAERWNTSATPKFPPPGRLFATRCVPPRARPLRSSTRPILGRKTPFIVTTPRGTC